jgi:predicted transcriptional regulator
LAEEIAGSLSRRERQIMDVIFRAREATAVDVMRQIPDPPSYSAVRAMLRILEHKGHLKHRAERGKYIYSAARPRGPAARSALQRVVRTFFDNSAAKALAALLDVSDTNLSERELSELSELVEKARKRGGKS